MPDSTIRGLVVSSEVQVARERLADCEKAEAAVARHPDDSAGLSQLREALAEMPGAVRMLLEAIERAAEQAGESAR